MNRRSSRFTSRSREAVVPQREARQAWLILLRQACLHGEWAARGIGVERFTEQSFANLVITTGRVRFPLPHVSAQSAAEAFLVVARGFVAAAVPENRQALADFMAAGARCLEQLLVLDGHAQASASRRRLGEED